MIIKKQILDLIWKMCWVHDHHPWSQEHPPKTICVSDEWPELAYPIIVVYICVYVKLFVLFCQMHHLAFLAIMIFPDLPNAGDRSYGHQWQIFVKGIFPLNWFVKGCKFFSLICQMNHLEYLAMMIFFRNPSWCSWCWKWIIQTSENKRKQPHI